MRGGGGRGEGGARDVALEVLVRLCHLRVTVVDLSGDFGQGIRDEGAGECYNNTGGESQTSRTVLS